MTPILRARVSKTFEGQRALHDVDLTLFRGEIHALVGQNGSGKSTLVKVLAGYHVPDAGSEVHVGDEPMRFGRSTEPDRLGLRFAHQDLGLVGSLDVISNLLLGSGRNAHPLSLVRWSAERRLARRNFADFDVEIDPDLPVDALSRIQQTLVAVIKALRYAPRPPAVLVLDEPTAALTRKEALVLFDAVRRFAAAGGAVLFISHHLDEVFDVADRVTVLRDGRRVGTALVRDIDHPGLVHMMLGTGIEAPARRRSQRPVEPALEVAGLLGAGLGPASFTVGRGEIVGIAGSIGCGATELFETLFGLRPAQSGTVLVGGKPARSRSAREAMGKGLAYIPSDRLRRASVPQFSIREDFTLPLIRHGEAFAVNQEKERAEVVEWLGRLGVVPIQPERHLASLSGGNQQKALLGRWLRRRPRVMLIDQPTQGVDVGARAMLSRLLMETVQDGMGILLFSTDGDELAHLCDRVLVMNRGQVVAELRGLELTPQAILGEVLQPRRPPGSEVVGSRA